MTDSKITKKYSASTSLSIRILAVSIFLLVIPLFLQTLFLYRKEYEQKVDDVQGDVRLLASERAHLIEEAAQMDWEYLEREGSRAVGTRDVQRIPLPPKVSKRFLLVNKNRNAFLVGVVNSNTSALVMSIPLSILGEDIPRVYPVRVAVLSQQREVLWENRGWENEDVLSASEPIGKTGLTIELGVETSQIQGLHLQSYYFRFATMLLFVGGIGGGAVYLFTRRIARPLANLCKTMDRVSEGAVHARYTRDWMGFEINDLGLQFNQTLDALLQNAEAAERERLGREKLAAELHIGREIQANLLPLHIPGLPGIDVAAGYFGAQEVNGDFYDLFQLENGNLFIAICDTAGKGISACLFSLGLRSILRSLASTMKDLSELVRKANDLYLMDAHESSMFSTVWLGVYDPKKQKLIYCSQGHPPALLLRKEECRELWTPGIALGAGKVDIVPTKELSLERGDTLVLYTDGVIEAHNAENELFGKGKLCQVLLSNEAQTAEQIKNQVLEKVRLFSQGTPQHDDMTLLVLRVTR